jgi:hypothetical protein
MPLLFTLVVLVQLTLTVLGFLQVATGEGAVGDGAVGGGETKVS